LGANLIAVAILIVAVGSALQAATGMGMALFAAPLLALVDPTLVPGPALCSVMVLSAVVAWRERQAVDRAIVGIALVGLAAGSALGAGVLRLLAGLDLSRVFAVLILVMVALSIAGLHVRTNRPTLLVGGAAAGILGTMSGVQGPPIALVLQHQPPDRLRATLCAFFSAGSIISLCALALSGMFGARQLEAALWLLPGVPLGVIAAAPLARHIDHRRARFAVLAISSLSAMALLLR
jgi:uncharacterized membrane protein YfcA